MKDGDKTPPAEPVTTVADAAKQKGSVPLVTIPPKDLPAGIRPAGHAPVPDNATREATVAPVGTPTAQLRPDLPRLGDGTARGETQPGIPPPGEAERAIDSEKLKELKQDDQRAERVTVAGGMITVGKRLVLPAATTEVEFKDDTATLVTASGAKHTVKGRGVQQLRSALGRAR